MRDFCFNASSEADIIAALAAAGLTLPGLDDNQRPVGEYNYVGQLVETPGEFGPANEVVTAQVMRPGVYAVYRADDDRSAALLAAQLPEGVSLVDPPAGLPKFGGEWLTGPDLAQAIAAKRAEIDAYRDSILVSGYAFQFEDGSYTLQTRNDEDRVNWLGVLNASTAMVLSGAGESQTKIRTAENAVIVLTWSATQLLMLQTLAYQSSIYESSWSHKDAVELLTLAEVEAYDVKAGWPS